MGWIDDLAPEDYRRWRKLRSHVLRRDGGRCQRCGVAASMPGDSPCVLLEAHHRYPVAEGGPIFPDDPDGPDGLIALCEQCHRDEHRLLAATVIERQLRRQALDDGVVFALFDEPCERCGAPAKVPVSPVDDAQQLLCWRCRAWNLLNAAFEEWAPPNPAKRSAPRSQEQIEGRTGLDGSDGT